MTAKEIKCPQCGRLTFYSEENSFRPFCSKRCRLVDLGQWADGKYKVPTEETAYLESTEVKAEDSDENS